MNAGVVFPVGHLGASHNPVTKFCRPACSDSSKNWFDGREVNARVELNVHNGLRLDQWFLEKAEYN